MVGWTRGALLAIVAGLLLGCTADVEPGGYPINRTVQIEEAVANADAAAIVTAYLEDAQVIPPETGEPVVGRAAIAALWQARIDAGLRAIDFTRGQLSGEDDKRFETGTYTSRNAAGEIDVGKFFTVWQQVDRAWFVSRHTWASDLDEAAASGAAGATAPSDVAPESPGPETATE